MPFHKILIANRGEIAVRILRTARRLGYATVAVYSDADAAAPHVGLADEAVRLGPPPVGESYLSVPRILDAARKTGADAVHPGYGFLSENADFARACLDAGLVFIGPPAHAIEAMGNKARAKGAMRDAGVPCVPGYEGADASDTAFAEAAAALGFPVMVKAAAGGGGRGMRLVHSPDALPNALASARQEAESAFKSGELLLEKAIVAPRHVEIQIVADSFGEVVHLGERDCSVQRRHQKVIEESPSPAVDDALREAMGAAAVAAAKACGYVGAGTVEMLLGGDGSFYFLEMNTRLQVEHPVTECVTGVDLVEWQIRIAAGERLPKRQSELEVSGHAIEARLYAEDPSRDYLPQTGVVTTWQPQGEVRVDHGLADGLAVSPFYDPMLAKVVAHGRTRDEARRKLADALRKSTVFGVVTNKAFLVGVLEDDTFARGGATTAFLEREFASHPTRMLTTPPARAFALAALASYLEAAAPFVDDDFVGWRSGGPIESRIQLEASSSMAASERARVEVTITAQGRGLAGLAFRVTASTETFTFEVAHHHDGRLSVDEDGVRRDLRFACVGDTVWTDDGDATRRFEDTTYHPKARERGSDGTVRAPLDGKVLDVAVRVGDQVNRGQVLVVVEAMKMEHRLEADLDGTVARVHVERGAQVKTRQLLVELRPSEEAAS